MEYVGKAHASSAYLPAQNALHPEAIKKSPWMSERGFPQSVWFQFEEQKFLTKIGFSSDWYDVNRAPKKFEVVGSMDCEQFESTAEVLLVVENAGFDKEDQAKAWMIPEDKQAPYLCIGINIHSVNDKETGYTSVRKMIMWENRVALP